MTHPPQFRAPLTPCNVPTDRCPVPRGQASKRILIMRTASFGDVLMGTPLLAALRRAYPTAHLTWLAEHSHLEAIDANPYVDEVIRWDGAYWKKMLRKGLYPLWLWRALAFRRLLRDRRYDAFISFQPEEWPTLMSATGAQTTIGIFDTFRRFNRATRTSPRTRLYTHVYAHPDLPPHRTDQYLLALRALGLPATDDKRMQLGYTAQDAAAADDFLARSAIGAGSPFVVLAPMTTWRTRNWPPARFVEVGDALARQGCKVVLIGSDRPEERQAATDIGTAMASPPALALGCLSFRGLAALLDRAALVISGDTGPMHMAAALGTPYVGIFGPTAPQWYAPLTGPGVVLSHAVPCGPCDQMVCRNESQDHRCMRLVTVAEVIQAARGLLPVTAPA